MCDKEELFDKDFMICINDFVESKSRLLNKIPDFKEIEKTLASYMDEFERDLSKEGKDKFDKIIKLMYQTEEYYTALSYTLGIKYGKNIEKI